MPKSRPLHIRFAAWCALLAVVLQLAAMPLANAHMLRRSLNGLGAQMVTICTPTGSKELLVGQDGQPLQAQTGKWMHCNICFVGGSPPIIAASGADAAPLPSVTKATWQIASWPVPSGAGNLWPFGRGPPA